MTRTTKEIFEKYEIRKTKKQRAAFREYVKGVAEDAGYACKVEKAGRSAHNIVVGSPSSAKVVYTAHYDTCAGMLLPNLITPKCLPIYILYQLLISAILYTLPFLMISLFPTLIIEKTGSSLGGGLMLFGGYVALFLAAYIIVAGPANKHTANDNTSGVTVLIDLMLSLPEEERGKVAFIFFDLEEMGLLGSQNYAKRHKAEMKNKLLINFDCVSDGKTILFAVKKGALPYAEKLAEAFKSNDVFTVDIATKGVFYPSDQKAFDAGVGVAALKKTKRGLLYMDKIHTTRDTVYQEENIAYLVDGSIKLAEII